MSTKRIPCKLIIAAKAQNPTALKAILQHYESMIRSHSDITLRNSQGKLVYMKDSDLVQIIASKLLLTIILRFNPYKSPEED